jgi:hypothetical protein
LCASAECSARFMAGLLCRRSVLTCRTLAEILSFCRCFLQLSSFSNISIIIASLSYRQTLLQSTDRFMQARTTVIVELEFKPMPKASSVSEHGRQVAMACHRWLQW